MSNLNAVVGIMTRLDGPMLESRQVQSLFFLSCELSKQAFGSTQSAPGVFFNPLNAVLNPICHLLALLGAHHILHVSRIRVKESCRSVKLTTQTHLLPGLRTSGAIKLLPPTRLHGEERNRLSCK